MTREEMINTYETYSKADLYQFGFGFHDELYAFTLDDLSLVDSALKYDHTSAKRGGYSKIRVRFPKNSRRI